MKNKYDVINTFSNKEEKNVIEAFNKILANLIFKLENTNNALNPTERRGII